MLDNYMLQLHVSGNMELTDILLVLFFILLMAGISQTRTISHYNTAESHSHYAL